MILLVYPPVAKPCEPPAGIARLGGMLGRHGVGHVLLDANIEGLLHVLGLPPPDRGTPDTWTRRSFAHCDRNISSLRERGLYRQLDRYKRAVRDIGKVLQGLSPAGTYHGLADYSRRDSSPVHSRDLLAAAEKPESSPYYAYFSSRLRQIFDSEKPSLVGLSLCYLSQALCAFSMIGFIRREFPGVGTILGGGLVTSWLRNPGWTDPFAGLVDHVVGGNGEFQLLSLLGKATSGTGLPRPDYRPFPRDRYLSPGFVLPYSASTGCRWGKCTFCPEAAEGGPYHPLAPRQVLADLAALVRDTNPSLIHLLDNDLSPALLERLCAQGPGVPWYGFSRVDARLADPDFCRALKESGCVMLKLGIESGDQGVLDALGKGIRAETAAAALRALKMAGIATYVYLLFGTPVETAAAARRTLAFTVRHREFVDFLNLALFNMPACGRWAAALETKRFSDGDLSLYTDFTHPRGWDRTSVRRFLEQEFKRHPAVATILKREAPVFTSNHAPFFVLERAGGS